MASINRSAEKPVRRVALPWRLLLFFAALYFLLLIPERKQPIPTGAGKTPFAWSQDAFWAELENRFLAARAAGCESLTESIQAEFARSERLLATIQNTALPPDAEEFMHLEHSLFSLAPLAAACAGQVTNYIALADRSRVAVKQQSQQWDLQSTAVRNRLYRLLHGLRLALEEVMLQTSEAGQFPELALLSEEPSATPSFVSHGLRLHSGDILVSRGGAPTSALIARGNDYPGSFSHVALLHVDEKTGRATVIESHIESGVSAGPFEAYLKDKKLRIMVLRPRADLPALHDLMLPHQAAAAALRETERRHIPYDFAMDYQNPNEQFCSEVVSAAYAGRGMKLWLGSSFISSPVVSAWLASVGVRHFETQEPSDLEYDPQLRVVAEWHDRGALLKAHVDDAVTDAMIANAKPGEPLAHNPWLLPFVRIAKGFSVILNLFDAVGPVPEGLSATEALRVKQFRQEHERLAAKVLARAREFEAEKGYPPPYWELVRLAKER